MKWCKWEIAVIVGFCIILLSSATSSGISDLSDDASWEKAFNRYGSIMLLTDTESGKIINANGAAAAFYGYTLGQLQSMYIEQIHVYQPEEEAQERLAAAREERNYFIFPHRLASGEVRTGAIMDIYSIGEYDAETNSVFGVLLDITARKEAEKALELSRKRGLYSLSTFLFVQLIAIIVLMINILQRRKAQRETRQNLKRNENLVRILQHPTYSLQELLDHALAESINLTNSKFGYIYLYSDDKKEFTLNTWSHDAMGQCQIIDRKTVYQLDKTGIWGEAVRQGKPIVINDFAELDALEEAYPPGHVGLIKFMTLPIFDQGKIVAVIGLANKETDYDDMDIWQITLLMNGVWTSLERKKSEMALNKEKERLRATLLSVGDGVIDTDRQGRIDMINEVAEKLTGWSGEEALGQPVGQVYRIIDEYSREQYEDHVQQAINSGKPITLGNHTVLLSKRGDEKPIADSAAPIRNSDGEINGAILVFRDVSEEKMRVDEIEYLSYHDQLTGLYNRRFCEQKLRELDNVKNLPLSIIMADLNGLKLVNDTFGHAMGDRFLRRAAQVVKKICKGNDIVARWGGDEFVFLLPKTTTEEAEAKVSKIERALKKEKEESMSISMSCGWYTKTRASEDLGAVFKSAEDHMYRAKLFERSGIRGETIQALMVALYEKNQRGKQHSRRVSALCQHLGQELGLGDQKVKELGITGLFHDIGKIAIEEQILNKPGTLTEEEWKEVKRHPEVGYRLLGAVKDMADIASYVLAHHERWDGLGYPKEVQGEDIPLQSRIIAIADAYDAMISGRPYKKSLSKREAIAELRKNAGKQFDPNILEICINAIGHWDEDLPKSWREARFQPNLEIT